MFQQSKAFAKIAETLNVSSFFMDTKTIVRMFPDREIPNGYDRKNFRDVDEIGKQPYCSFHHTLHTYCMEAMLFHWSYISSSVADCSFPGTLVNIHSYLVNALNWSVHLIGGLPCGLGLYSAYEIMQALPRQYK